MRMFLLTVLMLFFTFLVEAQRRQAGGMLNDKFKGSILPWSGERNDSVLLSLWHEQYADMGSFELNEHCRGAELVMVGEWTVLRGDVTDENATVVELDGKGLKPLYYFLRLKNGNLQQLDTTLREMKPTSKYILRKQ